MIVVEPVYKNLGNGKKAFQHFRSTIGTTVYEPVPIAFIRISELDNLKHMLDMAYAEGYYRGRADEKDAK